MNIFIVEDEELAVKKLLKTLLTIDPDIQIAGTADSISSSVEWLQGNPQPDLILMDIELCDGQSFEIFNLIEVKSPVIFTTSYDEYALKAFKVNSVDYLLKPIQKEDMEAALTKFRSLKKVYNKEEEGGLNMSSLVKELQSKLQSKDYRKRFLVKHIQKLISIEVDDIAYFYSDDRLNFFKTHDNKKFIVDYTMDEIEKMISPDEYFRINRAFLVSPKSIDQISDYFGNRLILRLNPPVDKDALVSREKVTEFKNWMGR
ncbi:MAG: response regulator transcription factor [Fimbriimonadaceae bacterium]|nr:response regulator transcription factor [Chitinophagales bacterium]